MGEKEPAAAAAGEDQLGEKTVVLLLLWERGSHNVVSGLNGQQWGPHVAEEQALPISLWNKLPVPAFTTFFWHIIIITIYN